uniref:RNA-directed RNA polymerase L n=1 Tax=Cacopsylla melanoneura TaxID=428564 RepID=A0A8D9BKL8_9HEMI
MKSRQPTLLPRITLDLPAIDLINHFYKTDSIITTASYKPLSILNELKRRDYININTSSPIVVLGDGVGGYSLLVGRIFPNCPIFYNTLFDVEKLSSVGLDNFIPAALALSSDIFNRVIHLDVNTEGISDILHPDFSKTLSHAVPQSYLVLCDAEGGGWEDPTKGIHIVQNICDYMIGSTTELAIIKTYCSRLDMVWAQIGILKGLFQLVGIVRSDFSSINSSECFLVAAHRKSEIVQGKTQILNVKRQLRVSCGYGSIQDFIGFTKHVRSNSETFSGSAQKNSEVYSQALQDDNWSSCAKLHLENMLKDLNPPESRFPESAIKHWRSVIQLVRFTHNVAKRFQASFLTDSIWYKVSREYLLVLSALIKSQYHLFLWKNFVNTGYISFYGSVDGSWSVVVRSKPHVGSGSVSKPLSQIIKGSRLKELLVTAGRIKKYNTYNVQFQQGITLENPSPYFAGERKEWWSQLGKECHKLRFTPLKYRHFNELEGKYVSAPIILTIPHNKKNKIKEDIDESWGEILLDEQGNLVPLKRTLELSASSMKTRRLMEGLRESLADNTRDGSESESSDEC